MLPTSQRIIAQPSVLSLANQSPPPAPPPLTPLTSSVFIGEVDLDLIPATSLGPQCPSALFVPLSDNLNGEECHHTLNRAVVLIKETEALMSSLSPIFLRRST
ncbi:hypothetical protein NE237_010745 [Protea cynaroides]|uniref:Uncharacterized protein n=1 Tax=Protea cynaroides TaxID=273540 RepID=A0A9Q0R1Z3_9MAGN|nr:hypothetical protein NE237_010745 [Protea cynaroides]